MATVHDLLASKGKQGAVEAGFDRSMVEVAAAYAARQSGWDWHDNQDEGGRCRDTGRT